MVAFILKRGAAFPTRSHLRQAKTQINLWVAKDLMRLQADNEDCDQPDADLSTLGAHAV